MRWLQAAGLWRRHPWEKGGTGTLGRGVQGGTDLTPVNQITSIGGGRTACFRRGLQDAQLEVKMVMEHWVAQ